MSNQSSSELQALVAARVARRDKMKAAYERLYNNPFRVKYSFMDPMLFRYEAARAYARDFYKFTPRSLVFPLGLVASVVALQVYINKQRGQIHDEIQSGQRTYYDQALWRSKYLF